MTSLETYLRQRLQRKKLLLMTHAVVGYPSLDANMAMLEAMQRAEVDVVELQLPFSEPIADGPIFVRANQHALEAGMNWEQYFRFMQRASAAFDLKILMMGYYNSVLQMGHADFCATLAEHGGSGFIVADLPPEEATDLLQHAEAHHLAPIVLMTPTNSPARLQAIARYARGFVYCVARRGVTGKRTQLDESLEAFMARCRQATSLPLSLGFGLRTGDDLRRLHGLADMGTLGTVLLATWEQGGAVQYEQLLQDLRAATLE
ncbi:MAG: tryptophan synthase subunit alpha [Candidatus Tectomicrobia bacterium]|uniref:Tryptophan synthase alpha chain n=1 Tax=Tectimicrobiota bacterium TaxID=2528274 RepID=A0A937W0T3_UNCTE|nr:tryptophan synthase subunit alpha [Candidatus Tectomicrobia bacterium]